MSLNNYTNPSISKHENLRHKSKSDSVLYQTENKNNNEKLHKIKQSRKGYLGNLSKCINRAYTLIELPLKFKDVKLIVEKIEFALMKLEHITRELCEYANEEMRNDACMLLSENKQHSDEIIKKCNEY